MPRKAARSHDFRPAPRNNGGRSRNAHVQRFFSAFIVTDDDQVLRSTVAMSTRTRIVMGANQIYTAFIAAVGRLDKSLSPRDTLARLQKHQFTLGDSIYLFHIFNTAFWVSIMEVPGFPLKLGIPLIHAALLLVPFTSQFFLPALPVTSWLMLYYSSQFIPDNRRPSVSVSILPTLESVLYGANISDLLTRFTHPILDVPAWLSYGVIHFVFPFVVAAFTWLFRPKQALHLWARAFGYLNLVGVVIQILFPCAAPWYEVIFGLTPADYSMKGSPGGLLRIDHLFHSSGYTITFSNSPVIFGAFPSLHSACATMEALFISHFFPAATRYVWTYASVLYWATMYLTHHYLIDVVGGACLATFFFYAFLPDDLRHAPTATTLANKYAQYDLEAPRGGAGAADYELSSEHSDDEDDIASFRAPAPLPRSPSSTLPLLTNQQAKGPTQNALKSHKHTASIASLIRADDRVEEGWSPIGNGSFAFPPTPTRETTTR
ncbi:hypothetical protein OF83DRAFT_1173781 [Amylostereum chailletii]|nr:hypothetical protein OF83DRAFT_1173781 [Amylostereum chailletii]